MEILNCFIGEPYRVMQHLALPIRGCPFGPTRKGDQTPVSFCGDPNHAIHAKCARIWLAVSSFCPICHKTLSQDLNDPRVISIRARYEFRVIFTRVLKKIVIQMPVKAFRLSLCVGRILIGMVDVVSLRVGRIFIRMVDVVEDIVRIQVRVSGEVFRRHPVMISICIVAIVAHKLFYGQKP